MEMLKYSAVWKFDYIPFIHGHRKTKGNVIIRYLAIT